MPELPPIAAPRAIAVHVISSAANIGLEELKEHLWRLIRTEREAEEPSNEFA
jgi:hypothetical protein